ncbi:MULTISPECIES: dsDNA nuclease domain-containing protein [Klebsiella pneumoniae complex]|uniref:dsDNA nuclease domain-containing protein n=3 Tax=Gammaproteobacteria TaxID=1236 RepID=UPI0005904681|nr:MULTISPECIES: SEC-C metal-binding domain-containing protein [Klebsiella]ANK24882.1 hypothetical protein WM47_27695 [Klebsiella pneumoniae]MCF2749422.1 dsDNA nuclease domain-containing protein [Klebsiella pneumoniae]MCJ5529914.1 dsDNA nuclease domain-containing protein [Klebsiella pneumoniae]MCM2386504.1 dsDNA nuclease domain-containing protein [Klebsiella pneumoniae]MCP6755375.1 dsDNA nuclease domain-containing protein [Klebsiella pneumoniae]
MQGSEEKSTPDVLDSAQLVRIEAVHRGFLYQHLYAVGCLLLAQKASIEAVTVELDEDIELNSGQERIYVQVKTRVKHIIPSDVSGALARLTGEQRQEFQDQSNYIAQLAYKAAKSEIAQFFGAVGRNEPCPCRSGKKYKKCHGT